MKKEILLEQIKNVGFKTKRIGNMDVPFVESAYIKLSKLSYFDDVFKKRNSFSHIDLHELEKDGKIVGGNSTCIDNKLGSVFGVSATQKGIVLVPQHRIHLMSFVNYYLMIQRYVDRKAMLMTFSDFIQKKFNPSV